MFLNIEIIQIPNLECAKGCNQQRNSRAYKVQKRLLINHQKPYHEASLDTLLRWIKETLAETNLIENFTNSVRYLSPTRHSI